MASILPARVRLWLTDNVPWIVMALAIIFGGVYAVEVHQEHVRAHKAAVFANCQSEYNKAFATQLIERSRLSTATSDAQTHILSEIGKALAAPPTTDAKVQAKRVAAFFDLFTQFDKNTDQIAADRLATPLPPIPDCG